MSTSIDYADRHPDTVPSTSAEEDIHNRVNTFTTTGSETGSQASDSSTYNYYLHASCPRCHHWLNKIPIKLFKNGRKHKRFRCSRCQRLLFGLGGNSTQTTLVSQETISRQGSRASASENPLGFHGCTNVRSLEPSRDGDLKTIVEASSSNGVSREPSQRSAVPRGRPQNSVQPPQGQPQNDTNSPSPGLAALALGHPQPEKTTTIPPDSGRFRKIKDHANRLLRKVKDINSHVRRRRTAQRTSTQADTQMVTSGTCGAKLENEASPRLSRDAVKPSIPSRPQCVSEHPLDNGGSHEGIPNAGAEPTREGPLHRGQDATSQEEMAAANKKLERIRCLRKEKRLRANALQKPRCECSEGCHCMQRETESRSSGEGQSRPVDPADIEHRFPHGVESPEWTQISSTTESRRLSSDVSSEDAQRSSYRTRRISSDISSEGPQQSQYRTELAGIGDRFSERRRSVGMCRQLSSLSQAATAVSNGSSISLFGGSAYISTRRPLGSRPQTPHIQINPDGGVEEDDERGGATPTQPNTTSRRTSPSGEGESVTNASSTVLEGSREELQDTLLPDHDGALLPRSEDAE